MISQLNILRLSNKLRIHLANTFLAETTILADKLSKKNPTIFEDTTAVEDKMCLAVFFPLNRSLTVIKNPLLAY